MSCLKDSVTGQSTAVGAQRVCATDEALGDPNTPVRPSPERVRRVWDLSTAHITPETATWLETKACLDGEHGFLVYVPPEIPKDSCPVDLAFLLRCAVDYADFILLDRDADTDPRLPIWDW